MSTLDEQLRAVGKVRPTVYEAWSAVMADVQAVGKSDHHDQQNYDFRGVDAVVNAVGPILRRHGVLVLPVAVTSSMRDVRVGRNNTAMRESTVTVTYRVYGPAGDHLDLMVPGEATDSGDKATPKAMSVAYRIALLQGLCIPTGEDAKTAKRTAARQITDRGSDEGVGPPSRTIQRAAARNDPRGSQSGQGGNEVARQAQKRALAALHASFGEAGFTDRDERLTFTRRVIGRDIASSNDLTPAEVSAVIDRLKNLDEPPDQPPPDEIPPAESD